MTAPRPTGSIDIWNFVDNVTGVTVRKWLRDSWARRKIVALQQSIADTVDALGTTQLTVNYRSNTYIGSSAWARTVAYKVAPHLCIITANINLSAAYTGTTVNVGDITGFLPVVDHYQNVVGTAGHEVCFAFKSNGLIQLQNGSGNSGEWFRFTIPVAGNFS